MPTELSDSGRRDILADWRIPLLVYCLPIVAILATGGPQTAVVWRTVVWTGALVIMGSACLINAMRCGRIHCYFTGPFFLALALVVVLFGTGVLPLGVNGWRMIGLALLIGGVGLTFGPELLLGKYGSR